MVKLNESFIRAAYNATYPNEASLKETFKSTEKPGTRVLKGISLVLTPIAALIETAVRGVFVGLAALAIRPCNKSLSDKLFTSIKDAAKVTASASGMITIAKAIKTRLTKPKTNSTKEIELTSQRKQTSINGAIHKKVEAKIYPLQQAKNQYSIHQLQTLPNPRIRQPRSTFTGCTNAVDRFKEFNPHPKRPKPEHQRKNSAESLKMLKEAIQPNSRKELEAQIANTFSARPPVGSVISEKDKKTGFDNFFKRNQGRRKKPSTSTMTRTSASSVMEQAANFVCQQMVAQGVKPSKRKTSPHQMVVSRSHRGLSINEAVLGWMLSQPHARSMLLRPLAEIEKPPVRSDSLLRLEAPSPSHRFTTFDADDQKAVTTAQPDPKKILQWMLKLPHVQAIVLQKLFTVVRAESQEQTVTSPTSTSSSDEYNPEPSTVLVAVATGLNTLFGRWFNEEE